MSLWEDGTLCGLNSDKEIDNESKQDRTTQPPGTQGGEQQDEGEVQNDPQIADSKRGAIIVRQEVQSDPQIADSERGAIIVQQDDPQVDDPEGGAAIAHAVIVHQDNPQDVDLERGAIANPQDVGLERELQVDPQPLPALSLGDDVPIDGVGGDNEHEMDQQSHSDHDAETQIQVPGPEVPTNWRPPTVSYISRELGTNLDPTSTGYKVWRPSNPHGCVAPEFDENGLLLNADSEKEDQPRQPGSQQGDLKEGAVEDDTKMPGLVRDPQNQNPCAALADDSGDEAPPASTPHYNSPDETGGETPRDDTSHHNSPNEATNGSPRTCASGASSSSGDTDDQCTVLQ